MLIALALSLATAHPHLYFGASDVAALRQKATTTHKPIADHIKLILDQHVNDPAPTTSDYSDPRFFGTAVAAFAFGWQMTGNTAYAAKARQMLLTYLGWSDWGFGEGAPDLNTAHMLEGVAVSYDWLVGYSGLSTSEAASIAARLGTEAQRMADSVPTNWWTQEYIQNHNWIDTAGLGLAALALSGEDARTAGWLATATANLQDVASVIGPMSDGSFHEGIGYQAYGLAFSVPFWAALARSGADYTDIGMLRAFGHWRLTTGIPESFRTYYLPYGDFSGWAPQQTTQILRYTAARFHDGLAEAAAQKWLAAGSRTSLLEELWYEVFEYIHYDPTVAAADVTALPLDTSYSDLQASILRSSWGAGDLTIAFKGMPYGGRWNFDRLKVGGAPGGHLAWGHDHNDDLSFWVFGNGQWLAPEAMGYDAGKNTTLTYWANETAYHNSILVDGQGQLGDARPSDSEWNNAWFWERDAQPLLATTGAADYSAAGGRGATLFDPALGITRWDRLVLLSRHRYALVRDDIQATATHAYDWLCHFSDGGAPDGTGWVQGTAKGGQTLGVRMISPPQWTAATGSQTATLMWKFDSDASISFVKVRPATAAASQIFLAALVPVGSAGWSSKPTITALDANDPGAGLVVAEGAAGPEERWIFGRKGGDGHSAGDLALAGSALAGMAARASGAPARALLVGAGKLSDNSGARQLLATNSAASIEVALQGSTLVVTGDGVADFQAYAPAATSATLNGVAVAADFESGMVVYPSHSTGGGSPDAGTADAGSTGGGSADAGSTGGGSADAGSTGGGSADAGSTGGGSADAGSTGGGTADAGSTGGGAVDAGTAADAGASADAGSPPNTSDGGSTTPSSDAGAAGDGTAGDPSTAADAGAPAVQVASVSCASGGGFGSNGAALLAGLALLRSRRRRARVGQGASRRR